MFFIEKIIKNKCFIIGIVCVCTVIGIIVYNIFQNNTEEEYIYFENEELVNAVVENEEVVEEVEKIKVHISGEVQYPGVIEIEEGARIIDAINIAGGLTEEADISKVNLAYILEDAMKIHIPNINDEEEEVVSSQSSFGAGQGKVMVNINTATAEEFQKLDGIGSSIALRIVAYRKENGKFSSIEELKNISGIGESKFEKIKNNIYVK